MVTVHLIIVVTCIARDLKFVFKYIICSVGRSASEN